MNKIHEILKSKGKERPAWQRAFRPLKPLIYSVMGTITHVITEEPVVALTFDDGPHEYYTPELLGVLKEHDALATFFMVGQAASQFPELVRQVYDDGHAIGNHTFSHVFIPSLRFKDRIKEIRKCQKALRPYGQRILRPPWGKQTTSSRLTTGMLGYRVIAWNVVAEDWLDKSAEYMADRLMEALRPGCIVLLHDRIYKSIMEYPQYDRLAAIEAVGLLLEKVKGKFRFVTVPQLLKQGKPSFSLWNMPV